jgi:hypothetical protein
VKERNDTENDRSVYGRRNRPLKRKRRFKLRHISPQVVALTKHQTPLRPEGRQNDSVFNLWKCNEHLYALRISRILPQYRLLLAIQISRPHPFGSM